MLKTLAVMGIQASTDGSPIAENFLIDGGAEPPTVVENVSTAEQAHVGKVLEHILPVSPRQPGLLNDAVITSSL